MSQKKHDLFIKQENGKFSNVNWKTVKVGDIVRFPNIEKLIFTLVQILPDSQYIYKDNEEDLWILNIFEDNLYWRQYAN